MAGTAFLLRLKPSFPVRHLFVFIATAFSLWRGQTDHFPRFIMVSAISIASRFRMMTVSVMTGTAMSAVRRAFKH